MVLILSKAEFTILTKYNCTELELTINKIFVTILTLHFMDGH